MLYQIISFCVGLVLIVSFQTGLHALEEKKIFLDPPKNLQYFTLGYNENIADMLWIRVIQDIDHCERAGIKNTKEITTTNNKQQCEHSWVFSMLDAVTTLSPKFRVVYSSGGVLLSVVVQDKEGARVIFERGIVNFPDDWQIEYKAAYHYMENLHNPKRAAELLVKAGDNGAPSWVYSLAARLYTVEGQALLAKSMLESLIVSGDYDERFSQKFKMRLDEINAILAKERSQKPSTQ